MLAPGEVNEALAHKPETVNSDPYGEGWMIAVRLAAPAELSAATTISSTVIIASSSMLVGFTPWPPKNTISEFMTENAAIAPNHPAPFFANAMTASAG